MEDAYLDCYYEDQFENELEAHEMNELDADRFAGEFDEWPEDPEGLEDYESSDTCDMWGGDE